MGEPGPGADPAPTSPAPPRPPESPNRSLPLRPHRFRSTLRESLLTLRANPLTLIGFVLTVAIVGLAAIVVVLPPVSHALTGRTVSIVPYDPNGIGAENLTGPNPGHWLGTDELGRDMFSRVLVAIPLDLGIGILIVGLAVIIGGGLGLVAGYWDRPRTVGGVLSTIILRVTDIFLAFPSLVLALALAAVLGRTLGATLIALTATWWPYYVRLVRGEVLSIKHLGYIPAARAAGVSELRILFRHVIRNLLEPLTVYLTLDIGTVLVTFSTIAFVGVVVPQTTPELGSMVFYYQAYLPGYLWLVLAPGAAIFVTVLGFSLLGDGLREVLDPRTRRAFAREVTAVPLPVPARAENAPPA